MVSPTRLLVATDFSEGADRAADVAIELAQRFGARIDWLHVTEVSMPYVPQHAAFLIDDYAAEVRHRALERLRTLVQRAADRGVEGDFEIANPPVVPGILRHAESRAVDWIVLGSHGHGALAGWIGGVASAVVRGAPCSVLVVRPGPSPAESLSPIVVGDDLSHPARDALDAAFELGKTLGRDVYSIHAIDIGPAFLPLHEDPRIAEIERHANAAAASELERRAPGLPPHGRTIQRGPAPRTLCGFAAAKQAGLLVVGARGHTRQGPLGSVAERAARSAPCSVLVVRPPVSARAPSASRPRD